MLADIRKETKNQNEKPAFAKAKPKIKKEKNSDQNNGQTKK
jgi:hypothetical protein